MGNGIVGFCCFLKRYTYRNKFVIEVLSSCDFGKVKLFVLNLLENIFKGKKLKKPCYQSYLVVSSHLPGLGFPSL